MRRALAPWLLCLPACLPAAAPPEAPDLATPPAPAALDAPPAVSSAGGIAPLPEDGLLAVPLDAETGGESLGRVIVSPGNPGEPGLWLRTSRASRTAQGTVIGPDGASVDVVVIPADGVSQLSAEAYAALGLAPGAFVQVEIYLR